MKKTKVWAHRGASAYAPENTIQSFERAIEMGADGIELDIQLTKDGEIVVIHDETIDRVSNGSGWVKDFTLDELKQLNVNKIHPAYGHVTIPTLAEVYELLKSTELTVNVEIKTGIVFYDNIEKKALKLADKMGMKEQIIYSSFNHYTVLKLNELNPSLKTGFLYSDGMVNAPEYAEKFNVEALHPALYNLQYPGFVTECKERNIELNVWTVNEEAHMKMLCEYGVNSIITNYPDVARKVVDEYFK